MLTSTSSEAIAAAQRLLLLSPWSSSMMNVKDGPQSLRESGKLLCNLVLISTTNNNNNACGELRSYLRQMHVEVLVHQINSFWWLVWWCAGYLVWCATQESDSAQQQQQQHDEHTSSSSSSSSLYLKAAQSSAEWQSAPLHKDDGSELFAHLPRAHTIWRQPALLASLTTLAELTWHLQELHQQHRHDGDQSSSSLCCPLCAAARCGNVLAADALWLLLHLHVLRSKTAKAHWGADANHLAQPCLHNNDDDDDDRSLMQHRMLQHGVLVCYAAVEEGKVEMVGRVVGRWMSRGAGAAHNNNNNNIVAPPSTSSLLHACVCAWMAHVQEIPPPHTADEHRLRDQRLRRSCAAILRAATIEDRHDEDHSSSCIVLRGVLHAMMRTPIFMGAAHQRASTVMEWLSRQQFVETVRVLAHAADVVWSSPSSSSSSSSLRRTKVQVMPIASASTVVGAAPTSRARISLVANTSATTCAEVVTSAPKIVRRYAQLHHCLTACMQDDHEMMMVCSAKHGAALAQLMLVLGASPWPLNPRNVSIVDGAHPLMVEEVRHLLQLRLRNPNNDNNNNNNKKHSSPASIMHVGDELHQLREHLSTLACAATAANHLAALAYAKWANKARSLATPQDRALASAGEVVREWADYAHQHDGVLRAAMAALEYDAHQPLARMMMIHVLARKVAALAHTQSVHINRDDDGVAKKKKTKHVDEDGMTRHTSCWLARYHAAVLRMYEQLTNTDALNLLGHVVQQHLHNNNNNKDDDDEMRQRLRREYEHVVEEVQTIDALLHATLRTVESQAAQRTNKHDDDDDDDVPRSSSSSPIMLMDEADPDRATYIRVAIPPLHTLPPVEGRSGNHHHDHDHRRWYTTMSTSHDDGMDVYVRVPDEMDVAATIAAHGGAWGVVDRPMPLFAPVQDGDVVVFVQQHRTNNNNNDDDDETRFVAVEVLMPASGLHRRRADHRGDDVRAWMRGGRVELPCCLRQKRAATQPTTAEEIMWRPLTHTDDDDDDEHLSRSYTSIMAISSSLPMLDAAVDLDLHICAPMQWMEMEVAPHMLMRDIISHMCASPSLCGRWRNIITGGTSWQWMYEAQAEVVVKQSTSSTCSAVAWGSMRTIPIPNNNKDKNDDDDGDDDDVVCALPVVAVEERLRGEVDDPLAGCSTEVLCVLQPTRSSPGINADDGDEMHLVGVLPRWGWRLMDGTNLHS